jgi:superfamily II DNA or RNA helicase
MSAGGMGIAIQWAEPIKVNTKYGTKWVRSWVIPIEFLEGFFVFWNKQKLVLRAKGYSIGKNTQGRWALNEWQIRKGDFKESFGKENPKVKVSVEDIPTETTLPKYEVKNVEGLREWQVPLVSQLCSAIKQNKAAIDGSDTGAGKTYVATATARELGLKIAVVCPKSVISAWKRVITKHFGMKPVFVLNYESVKTGKYKDIGTWKAVSRDSNREFFQWNLPKDTLIIFDESHRLKGHGTQNAEIAVAAKKQKYQILCCSATNAINPIELKATGLILGLYKKGFPQFLRDHDCQKGRFGWEFGGDKGVLKKLHAELFLKRGVRIRKEDIKGFPDCEIIAEAYNIDDVSEKEMKQVYAEMNRELTLLSAKCKNTAEWKINAMVIQLRARQKSELLKVPLFVEMIEDSLEDGMSVAVFLNFSETIKALSKRLNTNCIVWGENKGNERDKNIDAFQADEQRVILVNVQAGGAGLSLHDLNGKYPRIALISPTPSAVNLRQALGRIHRDGAKSKSLQKIIFIANTEEEETCERVKAKLENLDTINDGELLVGSVFDEIKS